MAKSASAKKTAVKLQRRPTSVSAAVGTDEMVDKAEGEKISLDPAAQPISADLPEEEIVTAVVVKPFKITRDNGKEVAYAVGVQEMPAADATHWFARAMGVTVYEPGAPE